MTLNEYQDRAMQTCMHSSHNFTYMMLNLVGEVGEFASKVAKLVRKQKAHIGEFRTNEIHYVGQYKNEMTELRKELGDILWQCAGLAEVHGWTLEEIAKENLEKLSQRASRNVIDGDGDNR